MEEKLLKAPDAAKMLNLSLQGVFRAAREKQIPSVRIGRHLRFSPTQLQHWIESQNVAPRGAAKAA